MYVKEEEVQVSTVSMLAQGGGNVFRGARQEVQVSPVGILHRK